MAVALYVLYRAFTMVEKHGVVPQRVIRNIGGWEDLKVGENGPSIIFLWKDQEQHPNLYRRQVRVLSI